MSEFSHVVHMVREIILTKNVLPAKSFYQSAIHMKYVTDLTSNAKYGDMLHPHASKQYWHLPTAFYHTQIVVLFFKLI